jgi:AcrR family transcriptional regulator
MSEVGLRARKRARTRDQIAEAAIRFFFEKGYEATTLEEIAEAAEVHKRTLLRYFPTKVHLVLHNQYAAVEEFRELLEARGTRPVVDLWQDHVVAHSRNMMRRGRLANTRAFARNEPAVEPAFLAIQAQYQDMVARALSADLGRDPADDILSKVAAAALIGGNYAVGAMIFSKEAYGDLETAELEVIRLVREGLLAGAG